MTHIRETIRYTHKAVAFRVLHSPLLGEPTGLDAYDEAFDDGLLVPVRVRNAMAPAVARATVAVDMSQLAEPWNWRDACEIDTLIEIVSDHADETERVGLFGGFCVEAEWSYSGGDKSVVLTAVGKAFRLLRDRDAQVFGRYMFGTDDKPRLYSSFPCAFNMDGRPNRNPQATEARVGKDEPINVYPFTHDEDRSAVAWTAQSAMAYLLGNYNADGTWMANGDNVADLDAGRAVSVTVEGLSLWEAIAEVAAAAGLDAWEEFYLDGGRVLSRIRLKARHEGWLATVHRQKPGEAMDAFDTDNFAASVAESAASSDAAPIVLGGRRLYEVTVTLQPAWDPAKLAGVAAADIVYERLAENWDRNYVSCYCVGGRWFQSYATVGRLWVANEDGAFSGAPYNLPAPDIESLVKSGEFWPVVPFEPLPLLSRYADEATARRRRAYVDWGIPEYGGVVTYHELAGGWQLLPDRLGLYLTTPSLADIRHPTHQDAEAYNFFRLLIEGKVFMRLTCTIAGPHRLRREVSRRAGAATAFPTGRVYERPQARYHERAAGAALNVVVQGEWDKADDGPALQQLAETIQDTAEGRSIEASFPTEWPETWIGLGDRLERIAGIDYDLSVNAGPARRWPRVVAVEFDLTAGGYSTQLTLDSPRKAGVVL